jgi:hypothetical protein
MSTIHIKKINFRLPVNLELVALVMRDESPDIVFYLDLYTGGIFSLQRPEDGDWEGIGEGFDHYIECGFRNGSLRFLGIDKLSEYKKKNIIEEFTASLGDQVLEQQLRQAALVKKPFTTVADMLRGRPTELCAWREHVERSCVVPAAEFLHDHEISNEAAPILSSDSDPEAALYVH